MLKPVTVATYVLTKTTISNITCPATCMVDTYIFFDFTECFITHSKTTEIPENLLFCVLSNLKLYYCCVQNFTHTTRPKCFLQAKQG